MGYKAWGPDGTGPVGGCHLVSGSSDPSVFIGSEFWFPELPLGSVWSPWELWEQLWGAGTSLGLVLPPSPAVGAQQAPAFHVALLDFVEGSLC